MQIAVSEFARHVAGMDGANSTEFDPETPFPVIDLLPEQKEVSDLGGTMRLGADPIKLHAGTRARALYDDEGVVYERHRHRYEVNLRLRSKLEAAGLIASGTSPDERLVEVIELADHPFFVASQFHPEFKSRPERRRRCSASSSARPWSTRATARSRGLSAWPRRRRGLTTMRPASDVERCRLNDTFAELCRIRSVSGEEAAMARRVVEELRGVGAEVDEPDEAGNVLARVGSGRDRSVLLCAHLDTVPHDGAIEPVCVDGGWVSAGETILGADNKAAVAVLLEAARRAAIESAPIGLELLFTVREEVALEGAKAFDVSRLRSEHGFVFDHATPIGEVIVASPTYYELEASFHGAAAHAGIRPEAGRSAIEAAARAIATMRLGRLDEETTANIGAIAGGLPGTTNVVAEHASFLAEARSLDDAKVEAAIAEMVDRIHDAANTPSCACDVDVVVEKRFSGYRHRPLAPGIVAAEAALRSCGYEPVRVASGGASDANAFEAAGFQCVNLANGTERAHQTDERVSVAALEGMLDVTYALLDEIAAA